MGQHAVQELEITYWAEVRRGETQLIKAAMICLRGKLSIVGGIRQFMRRSQTYIWTMRSNVGVGFLGPDWPLDSARWRTLRSHFSGAQNCSGYTLQEAVESFPDGLDAQDHEFDALCDAFPQEKEHDVDDNDSDGTDEGDDDVDDGAKVAECTGDLMFEAFDY
jgi:hypothetical protein